MNTDKNQIIMNMFWRSDILASGYAWAYMRDANGGNALSKLDRYETSLLREYDRSRQKLEKLQKIRAARPTPPPSPKNYEGRPIPHNPNPPNKTCTEYATTHHPKPTTCRCRTSPASETLVEWS